MVFLKIFTDNKNRNNSHKIKERKYFSDSRQPMALIAAEIAIWRLQEILNWVVVRVLLCCNASTARSNIVCLMPWGKL